MIHGLRTWGEKPRDVPSHATIIKDVRKRILAGEDLVGFEFTAFMPAHGVEKCRIVSADVEKNRLVVLLGVDGRAVEWKGPIKMRKASPESLKKAKTQRAFERELVRQGMEPCAWRNPRRAGGGHA